MRDRQGVAIDGETHLRRVVDMYEEPGFEVRLDKVKPEEVEQCTQCLQQKGERIYQVHARRKQEARNK
jgi:hypothetical protein